MTGSSRRTALAVLCVGMLMIILDGTVVTVALPSIAADLGFSPAGTAWVVNGYLVAFGGLLLLAGRFGDLLGRRSTFLLGLAVFVLASVLCGLAGSPAVLVAARFVQGAGGAAAAAVVLGMVVTLFPEAGERARAIGVVTFVGAAGASLGLVAGGVLTEALNWRWVFLVNVPIGVLALAAAVRVLPRDRGLGLAAGADALGAVLVTAGLMLGVGTVVQAPGRGWLSPATLGSAAGAVALLAGFVARQARTATPLLPLRIFRSRAVSGANSAQLLMVAAALGFQFLSALFLQDVLGYGAAATGLAVLPVAAIIGTLSLGPSGRLAARFGARTVLLGGLGLLAVGMLVLARVPADAAYAVDLLPALLLLGVGVGLALPTVTALAMSDATEADAGLTSGLANTAQQIGGAVGISVLVAVAAARTGGSGSPEALAAGYRAAFAGGTGFAVAAFVLAAVVLRAPTTARPALMVPTEDRPATREPATCPAG